MASSPRLESAIVKDILTLIRARGGWAMKSHGGRFQQAGVPDIIACVHGRFVGIEVKRTAHHPATALQGHTLLDIKDAGGVAFVAWNVDMVIQVLDVLDAWTGHIL